MSVHLSPRYRYVTLVSRYPSLTAVNWSLHECPIKFNIDCIRFGHFASKCDISHPLTWAGGGARLFCHHQFLGWILSQIFLHTVLRCARFACVRAPLETNTIVICGTCFSGGWFTPSSPPPDAGQRTAKMDCQRWCWGWWKTIRKLTTRHKVF